MNERRSLQLLAEKYEQVREAPYADPEVRRQKDRIYNRIHKDIKAKKNKIWRLNNPEYIKQYHKKYRLKNPEYSKKYRLNNAVNINKSARDRDTEIRKKTVADSNQGNWTLWLKKLAIEKNKPRNKWKWEVTVDYLLGLWPKDNKCPILRTTFTLLETGTYNPEGPSIDRINPNLNYVPGNVRVISTRANTIKSNGTAVEINAVAEWMRTKGATPDFYFNEN